MAEKSGRALSFSTNKYLLIGCRTSYNGFDVEIRRVDISWGKVIMALVLCFLPQSEYNGPKLNSIASLSSRIH